MKRICDLPGTPQSTIRRAAYAHSCHDVTPNSIHGEFQSRYCWAKLCAGISPNFDRGYVELHTKGWPERVATTTKICFNFKGAYFIFEVHDAKREAEQKGKGFALETLDARRVVRHAICRMHNLINDTLGSAKSDEMPNPPRVFTRISYVFATSRLPQCLNCLKQSLSFPEVAITSPGVVSHQWRRSTIGQLLTYEPSVTPARTFTSRQKMLVYQEIPEVISAYKPTRREKRDAARGLTTLGSRS